MDIQKIRNEALTEDEKMEAIADYIESSGGSIKPTLDEVLENGNTATHKELKLRSEDSDKNFTTLSETQVYTQKEYAGGAAIAQITSDGKFSLDYGPAQGTPTYLTIEVSEGTPKVMMSDNMKDAFRTALGI